MRHFFPVFHACSSVPHFLFPNFQSASPPMRAQIYLRLKFERATWVAFTKKHWRYHISLSSILYCACCASKLLFVHYFTADRSVAISMSVCMCVCLSAYLQNHMSKLLSVDYKFPVTVSRFSSDDRATRRVLQVLWMTSCVHTGHI